MFWDSWATPWSGPRLGPPRYQSYGGNYNSQQYGSTAQQQQPTNASTGSNRVAAAALSNLSGGQEYNQQTASRSAQKYDNPGPTSSSYSSQSYSRTNLHVPNRTQTNTSPVYANNNAPAPSATFGKLSYSNPPEPVQRSSSTHAQQTGTPTCGQQSTATTAHSYQPSYITASQSQAHTQPHQPQRYASPPQAVQAQQHQNNNKQQTRPSPKANSRPPPQPASQQSASVEPASTTVDPSQGYDFGAEREKKAKIEPQERRKYEETEAARKAEQDRIDEERREEGQQQREAEEKPKAGEAAKEAEKRQRQAAKAQRIAAEAEAKKRREEEQRMAMARDESNRSETAANALTQMASSGGESGSNLPPPANAEEAEIRALFKKMREFNSRNPAMLAKIWEEERRSHAASQSTQPAQTQPRQAPQPSQATSQPAAPTTQRSQQEVTPPPASANAAPQAAPRPLKIPPKAAPAPKPAASQATGSSLWPPGKKGFLAEIAAQWLSARNPHRAVSKQEVLDSLVKNPNYAQLCESLEGLGLKIERGLFARELLRAVPSSATQSTVKLAEASMMTANGTVAQANGTTPPDAWPPGKRDRPSKADLRLRKEQQWKPVSNGTVDYGMPNFSLAAAAQKVNNMHRVQSQDNIGQNNANQDQSGGPVQPPQDVSMPMQNATPPPTQPAHEPTPEVKHASPPRPPADKEEAARKRGFGDLVDLMAEDSDEEPPPKKMMQLAQGQQSQQRPAHGQAAHSLGFQYQHQDGRTVKKWAMPYGLPQQPPVQQPIPLPAPHLLPSNNGSIRSPSMAPPGQFQQPPLTQAVPMPHPKRKGPTQEQLQHERIRGKMVVEPIMRDRVARRSTYDIRTIARDVLLVTGRHPDMRALNSHLNTMQRWLGERGGMLDQAGNKADLTTIRWDIIDPESAKKVEKAPIEKSVEIPEFDVGDADDEDDMSAPGLLAPAARQQAVGDGDGTIRYVTVMDSNPPPPVDMRKKRGHKPKDRHSAPRGDPQAGGAPPIRASAAPQDGGERGTPRQTAQRTRTLNTAPANRTAAASPAATGAIGHSQFRKQDADGNPIKTKGRPVGWRKSIHSREAQGLTPVKPGTTSGSKLRQSAACEESPLQEPKYQVYKCMWVECKAELHSLETLKKHVVKVHGHPDSDGLHTCLWQGCQARSADSSRNDKVKARSAAFGDIEHWINHIDKEHLQPVAWELGDGPRGGLSDHPDTESEAYLSDSHGRSVTPIIRPFEGLNTIGEATSRVMPAPRGGSSRAREDAEHELGKLEERKRAVGVPMEKQGVRLANGKRRLGFLDDEDFEDFVESEGNEGDGT